MTLLTKQQIEALLNGGIVGQCDLRDHAGDLARTAIDVLARLEDAEAAQALVLERAVEWHDREYARQSDDAKAYHDEGFTDAAALLVSLSHEHTISAAAIRALAPASGVEALAALRAERDDLRECLAGADARNLTLGQRLQDANAERDDALTRLAAAEGRVAALTEALEKIATSDIQSFMLDANFGLIKLSDNRRYCDEPDVKRLLKVAKAALATVTPPADTTEGRT